jgi:hypothetical protein
MCLYNVVPKPSTNDSLFIEEAVYDYLLDFEKAVLWFYVGGAEDVYVKRHNSDMLGIERLVIEGARKTSGSIVRGSFT